MSPRKPPSDREQLEVFYKEYERAILDADMVISQWCEAKNRQHPQDPIKIAELFRLYKKACRRRDWAAKRFRRVFRLIEAKDRGLAMGGSKKKKPKR